MVAAAFRPPPVRVALKGDATSRRAETAKDIRHGKEPLDASHYNYWSFVGLPAWGMSVILPIGS
jgi:hypothetical protein